MSDPRRREKNFKDLGLFTDRILISSISCRLGMLVDHITMCYGATLAKLDMCLVHLHQNVALSRCNKHGYQLFEDGWYLLPRPQRSTTLARKYPVLGRLRGSSLRAGLVSSVDTASIVADETIDRRKFRGRGIR